MVVSSMSYATYDSYKDSGVDWLGEIPSDWELEKAKWLFKKMERPVSPNDEIVTCFRDGQVTLRSNRRTEGFTNALKEHGYQGIRKGDLVIHQMDAFAGAIGISDSDGKSTPVYSACVPFDKNRVESKYYSYFLRNLAYLGFIESLAKGIRERSTDFRFSDFAKLILPVPAISEQREIVDFIDKNLAQIDQAIALKQQQIEKLGEYKQIVIQNAVTKGLNPNAPMKDSGVEWIGDIPEHWEVKKLKHFGVIKSGDSVINSNLTDEGLYEVYGGNGFMGFYNKFNIDKESIIIGRVGALCGNVRYIKEKKWITDNALIFKLNSKFKDYEYLALVLEAGNLNRLNTSNAQPLITGTKVVNFSIPIPCEKERCEILDVIKSFSTKYSQAITNYQTQIHRLKEYKNILINQAVTGKIKI